MKENFNHIVRPRTPEEIMKVKNEIKSFNEKMDLNPQDAIRDLIQYLAKFNETIIQAGVGCLIINEKHELLVYKRFKGLDKGLWCMLGGSGFRGKDIEMSLKQHVVDLIGCSTTQEKAIDDIIIGDLITVNNHYDRNDSDITFHYLSPAFYVKINNVDNYLYRGNSIQNRFNKNKKLVLDFNIKAEWDIEFDVNNPWLAWIPIQMINDETKGYFTNYTISTLESHKKFVEKVNPMIKYICNNPVLMCPH